MKISDESELVGALSLLALLIVEKAFECSDPDEIPGYIKRAKDGRNATGAFFSVASELEVSDFVRSKDVIDLLRLDDPVAEYFCINLFLGICVRRKVVELIQENIPAASGVALLRCESPSWIFWCPEEDPFLTTRIAYLNK